MGKSARKNRTTGSNEDPQPAANRQPGGKPPQMPGDKVTPPPIDPEKEKAAEKVAKRTGAVAEKGWVNRMGQPVKRPQPIRQTKQIVVRHLTINAVASDLQGIHIPAHIELRLSVKAREGMRLLMGGCINSIDGVDSRNKVLSWLLEQIAEQAESGSSGSSGPSDKSGK